MLRKRIICLVVIAVMVLSMTACGSKKEEISSVISEFEYSCKNLDIDAVLDCLDPSISQPYKALLVGASLLTGTDADESLEETLDTVVQNIFGEDCDPTEFLQGLTIEQGKIKTGKNQATAECIIRFEISGESFRQDVTISLKKTDDQWYISNIQRIKE